MKKTMQATLSLILVIVCLFALAACGNANTESPKDTKAVTGLWKDARYQKDTTLGNGSKTVVVEVAAEEKTVTFTIKTDKKTVGDALLEHELIDGEESEYGLYVKIVNGMTADYDVDQSYWAFYVDGEYATQSVDATEFTEGVTYQLAYTK